MHSFPRQMLLLTKTTKYCAPLLSPSFPSKIMAISSDPHHIQKWFLYKAPDAMTWFISDIEKIVLFLPASANSIPVLALQTVNQPSWCSLIKSLAISYKYCPNLDCYIAGVFLHFADVFFYIEVVFLEYSRFCISSLCWCICPSLQCIAGVFLLYIWCISPM